MAKNSFLFLVGSIMFVSFLIFSYCVHINLLKSFDLISTVFLQSHISHNLDMFFSYFSVLGTFEVSCFFLLLIIVFLFFSKRRVGAAVSAVVFGLILLFELFGKVFIKHPSPPEIFARYKHLVTLPTDIIPHPSYSFPSGHSSRTLFLSTLIIASILQNKSFSKRRKSFFIGLIIIYDLIMLLSRIYLGEHWTSDVIGGILLGSALGLITLQATNKPLAIKNRKRHK